MLKFDLSKVRFASTRYVGCKRRSIDWIFGHLEGLNYDTCLDACGGTGIVSFEFKKREKHVHYNDILRSNYFTGKALIENKGICLSSRDIEFITTEQSDIHYPDFIQKTFKGVFFRQHENHWLDVTVTNINTIDDQYKQALAFHCLFQASLAKRPFNLFHRKNLNLRLRNIERTFGNKTTWERPFDELFRRFANEANSAIFDNGRANRSFNENILAFRHNDYDLVYLDSPFICTDGDGTDYFILYGFLEGLSNYGEWKKFLHYNECSIGYKHISDEWTRKTSILSAFEKVFKIFKDSIIVISYRSPGTPSQYLLRKTLQKYKRNVTVHSFAKQYALSKNKLSREVLLIGK